MTTRTTQGFRPYKILLLFTIAATAFACAPANAQTLVRLSDVPTKWLLQEYVPDNVVLFYTGSSCQWGRLDLPGTATADTRRRLWATVLAAKMAAHKVFVYYSVDSTTGQCLIQSYGAESE